MKVSVIDEIDFGPRAPTERKEPGVWASEGVGFSRNVARLADGLLVLWVVVAGVSFFRQFWDTAIPYLARLFR